MSNESYKKISSLQNPLVKHLVKLREDPYFRKKEKSVLVTGKKVILELIKTTIPKRIFFTDVFFSNLPAEESFLVTFSILKKITNLPAPEQVVAEFFLPLPSNLEEATKILVLNQVTDPGNAGTLIRSALAFGWDGIFFLGAGADPFHEKLLRSSRGALFRIPFTKGGLQKLLNLKEKIHAKCLIADLSGTSISQINKEKKLILVLSHEAKGAIGLEKLGGSKVTIPMPGEMESLNVAIAGSILMYHLGK